MNNDTNSDVILISYYEGAYGPTIRIDIQSNQSLSRLMKIFLDLSRLRMQEFAISTMASANLTNFDSFILCTARNNKLASNRVHLIQKSSHNLTVYWYNTTDGWRDCADLLDGLIINQEPGHQYLTDEDTDNILIEVAFREKRINP